MIGFLSRETASWTLRKQRRSPSLKNNILVNCSAIVRVEAWVKVSVEAMGKVKVTVR
jgi:hypothetical protein